jgi:hypothetical protein
LLSICTCRGAIAETIADLMLSARPVTGTRPRLCWTVHPGPVYARAEPPRPNGEPACRYPSPPDPGRYHIHDVETTRYASGRSTLILGATVMTAIRCCMHHFATYCHRPPTIRIADVRGIFMSCVYTGTQLTAVLRVTQLCLPSLIYSVSRGIDHR